jgi:hypothetical protein
VWPPHIISVSPAAGSPAGGTEVTVNGSGFGPAGGDSDVVYLCPRGGACEAASDVEVRSDSVITATTPKETDDMLQACQSTRQLHSCDVGLYVTIRLVHRLDNAKKLIFT